MCQRISRNSAQIQAPSLCRYVGSKCSDQSAQIHTFTDLCPSLSFQKFRTYPQYASRQRVDSDGTVHFVWEGTLVKGTNTAGQENGNLFVLQQSMLNIVDWSDSESSSASPNGDIEFKVSMLALLHSRASMLTCASIPTNVCIHPVVSIDTHASIHACAFIHTSNQTTRLTSGARAKSSNARGLWSLWTWSSPTLRILMRTRTRWAMATMTNLKVCHTVLYCTVC